MRYSTYCVVLVLICLNLAISPPMIIAKGKIGQSAKRIDKNEIGKRYLKLGDTYREAQNYEMADKYFEKAFNIFKYHPKNYWLAVTYEYYGYLAWDLHDKEAALSNFQEAKNIYDIIITQKDGSPEAITEVIDRLRTMEYVINNSEAPAEYPPGQTDTVSNKVTSNKKDTLAELYSELRKEIKAIVADVRIIKKRLDKIEAKTDKIENQQQHRYELPPGIIRPFPDSIPGDRHSGSAAEIAASNTIGTNVDGTVIVMPGVGFGSTIGIGTPVFPPSSLTLNVRISELYEIGLFSGYSTEIYQGGNITYTMYGMRIMYRLFRGSDWDLSSSIIIAKNDVTFSGLANNPSIGAILYGGVADFRYFVTNNIGLFVEAGYGVSFVSAGIAMKF